LKVASLDTKYVGFVQIVNRPNGLQNNFLQTSRFLHRISKHFVRNVDKEDNSQQRSLLNETALRFIGSAVFSFASAISCHIFITAPLSKSTLIDGLMGFTEIFSLCNRFLDFSHIPLNFR
jgi:hypothetical protein